MFGAAGLGDSVPTLSTLTQDDSVPEAWATARVTLEEREGKERDAGRERDIEKDCEKKISQAYRSTRAS